MHTVCPGRSANRVSLLPVKGLRPHTRDDRRRLIDELIISFTHTRKIDWMLPGVEPTGKRVEAVFVVIVGIEGDKVSYEHIVWDQASVLVQIGLLDPTGLPVTGAGAVAKLRNPALPDPFFNEG